MTRDEKYMQRAVDLAKLAGVNAAPNPMVGAVIVWKDNIIGEGYHQKFGEAHAEVNAVNAVQDKSLLAESTIYVTLEPCAHYGKTPPCADLLVTHQFKRVVIGTQDPFAKVNGAGINRLKEAGIQVDTGVLEKECKELNKRFFTFHEKKRPYIVLKWAESRDGFLDQEETDLHEIVWITGTLSKILTHTQRSQESAIMVGWKTIAADNATLTVREVDGKNPLRFIIDPQLKSPKDSTVFTDGLPTVVLNDLKSEQKGALTHVQLSPLNVYSICDYLHQTNILSVYVEGGSLTHQHLIDANLWDEIYRFIGPNNFNKGTKAPSIQATPINQRTIEQDELIHYINPSNGI